MEHLIKILIFVYIIAMAIMSSSVDFIPIAFLLMLMASNVFRYKYMNASVLIAAEAVVIYLLAAEEPYYIYLYAITAYDIVKSRYYYLSLLLLIPGMIFLDPPSAANYFLVLVLCGYFAHISLSMKQREEAYREAYDSERHMRYELEKAKSEVQQAATKIEHLTEVRERNRIAREIHDSVGHSLAGIMMQLQASLKLKGKDDLKAYELLKNSIDGLSEAIVTLRETVHNIKPREATGLDYIKKTIDDFKYCTVEFSTKGDMSLLKPHQIEIFSHNIKESLTNISRYSGASKAYISIEANMNFARLCIKDNGVGCKNIKEGLGLSGMKERVHNVGGTISINGDKGFTIVCIIPMNDGGDEVEGADC